MYAPLDDHDFQELARPEELQRFNANLAKTPYRGVIMGAPVIDPLGRYRYAKQLKESGKPYPEFVDLVLPLHDKYWKTEEAMAEGNPGCCINPCATSIGSAMTNALGHCVRKPRGILIAEAALKV